MKDFSSKFLVYLIGFLWSIMGYGQDPLSLSDAIQLGLANNYNIRIEEKNVLITSNNNSWGEAGRWPTITLDVSQNNGVTDNVRTASPFQAQDLTISNSLSPGINLNWTLFNGFKINMNKRRLEQLDEESQGNASIVIANTLQSIILGYYMAVLERDRLAQFQQQLNLSADRLRYISAKAAFGSLVTSDLLLEEGNYLTDSVNLVNQQLVYRNAVRNLNVLLSIEEVEKNYVFTDSLRHQFPDYEYADLATKLFDQNIDLRKQYISQSILNTNIAINRADRYPVLSLNAGASENRSRVDLSNASFRNNDGTYSPGPSDPISAITDNYFANFRLSFTLFNGGKINRAIKNAIIQEDIGNIRIEMMKNSLERDLQEAYDRYEIRKQLFGINDRRLEVAETNLEISSGKFQNGSINSFDFRIVQNNYLAAAILRSQAQYNLIDSMVELLRLTGGLISDVNNIIEE